MSVDAISTFRFQSSVATERMQEASVPWRLRILGGPPEVPASDVPLIMTLYFVVIIQDQEMISKRHLHRG